MAPAMSNDPNMHPLMLTLTTVLLLMVMQLPACAQWPARRSAEGASGATATLGVMVVTFSVVLLVSVRNAQIGSPDVTSTRRTREVCGAEIGTWKYIRSGATEPRLWLDSRSPVESSRTRTRAP